jgi:hypothetical protein
MTEPARMSSSGAPLEVRCNQEDGMRTRIVAVAIVTSCMGGNEALAQDAEAAPRLEPMWAVDVGAAFMGGYAGAGAGSAGIGGWGPIMVATLERRLDDRLWLMLRGSGSYDRWTSAGGSARAWSAVASAGIRHALTPREPLQVSWHAMLAGEHGRADHDGDPSSSLQTWGAGLRLGFDLDRHFTDWLALRLGVEVAQLGYQRMDGAREATSAEGWFARASLSPAFAVRFAF